MSFRDVQIALDVRLALLGGSLPVAWENTNYQAVTDVAFLRPTLLNIDGRLSCMADGSQENRGIYRVDANYPAGIGHSTMMAKLDAIYTHFKASQTLTVGSTSVRIRNISTLPRIIAEGSWFMGSIDINFVNWDSGAGGVIPPVAGQEWISTSISLTPEDGKKYITTNDVSRVVFTLPEDCLPGYYFRIAGYGLAGWQINCPAGMSIIYGDQETSVGGSLASINPHDCIELVCVVANTKFEELSSQGNITVT